MVIQTLKTLVKSLFALALLVTPNSSLSQTPPIKNNNDASSQDKQRLERFEKQVEVAARRVLLNLI